MCAKYRTAIQVRLAASYKSGKHVLDISAEFKPELIHSPVSIAHILSSPTASVVHMSRRLLAIGRLDTSAGLFWRKVALLALTLRPIVAKTRHVMHSLLRRERSLRLLCT